VPWDSETRANCILLRILVQSRKIKQHPSPDDELTDLVSGQSEWKSDWKRRSVARGHEVPSSEVCATNPNPADSLDNEGERKEDRDAQG